MTEPLIPAESAIRSDGELLRRYLEGRDAAALTELITRHAALVRGVCRRVLGDTPDADDAFQATFLVLIRRGERIVRPESLAAWLYGVAHRIAWRQRRQQRLPATQLDEGHAMAAVDPLTEMATQHDAALFDAELALLPEKYRAPIILHHLEGKTLLEVAAELRLSESAVDGRLKRGRNELRLRLARRGVVFGVTLAAVHAAQQAVAATPANVLIRETVQTALALDQILPSDIPHTPADQLARQELVTMNALQFTKAAGWGVAATLLFGVAGAGLSQHEALNLFGEDEPAAQIATPLALAEIPDELTLVSVAEAEEDGPAQPAAKPDSIHAEAEVEKLLDTHIDFKVEDMPLKDALQQLAKQLDVPWEPLAEQLIDPKWRVNVDLTQASIRHILMILLEPVGLEHHFDQGKLGLAVTGWTQNQRALDIIEENLKQMIGGFAQNQQLDPAMRAWHLQRFQQTLRWIERHREAIEEAAESDTPLDRAMKMAELTDVVWDVDQDQKLVRLRISRGNNLRPGRRARVIAVEDGAEIVKGTIEIIRVVEDTATATIIEQNAEHPITVNDEFESLEPPLIHAGEKISIVGDVDLDGDGSSDRELFHKLLQGAGIEITNEINDAGQRTGEKLGEETKFLVIGDIPDARLKRNRAEREQVNHVMGQLRELRKEARLSGVRIVSLNDFLEYIGQPKANPIPNSEAPRPLDFRKRNPAEVRIEQALHEATEMSFTDTSLYDALDYIDQLHNVAFVIDKPRLKELKIENPTVNLEVTGVELASALNLMLEPLGLDYIIKDQVLHVTSLSHAEEHHELRIYDLAPLKSLVDDLDFADQKQVDRVLRIVQDAVVSRWEDDETDYFGRSVNLTPRGLIVRHNQRTHREIENFLEQLQRAEEK